MLRSSKETVTPTISVIVPCRNERAHLDAFLGDVRAQQIPEGFAMEVIVAEGGSDDGTSEVLSAWEAQWPLLRVISNPRGIVSAGLNRAIRLAKGLVIVRMDVHTRYAPDYVAESVAVLEETGADCVGGPWMPRGTNYVSGAIERVFDSWFVSGGGRAHCRSYEGQVDTVYLGCWKREAFEHFGLFDPNLVRSQDNELNFRICKAGGTVWQSPRIRSWYEPRGSLRELWRQYTQYGYWKAHVLRKHRQPATWRQLVPPAFVTLLVLLVASALVSAPARFGLVAVLSCYAALSIAATARACRGPHDWRYLPIVPVVCAAHQFGFGYGFLRGVMDTFVLRRSATESFRALTRTRRGAVPRGSVGASL